MIILGGTPSKELARRVAEQMGERWVDVEVKRFPDGEKYVRIVGEVRGESSVVVQSMYHTPDEYLVEFLLIADNLKSLGAKSVVAVFPYMAYARQDERFKPGEAISFMTVAKLVRGVGVDRVLTIDSHRHRKLLVDEAFAIPVEDLTAMRLLAGFVLREAELERPVVVGPDREAKYWARLAAESIGAEYDVLEKKRLSAEEVEVRAVSVAVQGRDVLIADDIISTGGTIVEAVKALRRQGVRKVAVACTHPVLTQGALERIKAVGVEVVVGTDTIPGPISLVSVASVISEALRR